MAKRAKSKKPIRKVTSVEEQQERAELARYRASLRRIQEIDRLAKTLHRARDKARVAIGFIVEEELHRRGLRAVPIETTVEGGG